MATNKKHDVENPIVTDGNGDLKHPDDSAHNTSSRKVAVDDIEKVCSNESQNVYGSWRACRCPGPIGLFRSSL